MTCQSASHEPTSQLRSVDRDLLVAMRQLTGKEMDSADVCQLTDSLGVTATAVRQRIERLRTMGLIEREKVVSGRGRPTFRYRLTLAGHRSAGANANALADAMWREILELDDTETRAQLLSGIAVRLGRQYAAGVNSTAVTDDEAVGVRMQRLSQLLAQRQVVNHVTHSGELPVLDIGACPYPTLTDTSDDRSMCKLEEQMFSEALGQQVHLSSCRLDGDACCQFSPVADTTQTAVSNSK